MGDTSFKHDKEFRISPLPLVPTNAATKRNIISWMISSQIMYFPFVITISSPTHLRFPSPKKKASSNISNQVALTNAPQHRHPHVHVQSFKGVAVRTENSPLAAVAVFGLCQLRPTVHLGQGHCSVSRRLQRQSACVPSFYYMYTL